MLRARCLLITLFILFASALSNGQTITTDTLLNDSNLLIIKIDSGSLHSGRVWKEITFEVKTLDTIAFRIKKYDYNGIIRSDEAEFYKVPAFFKFTQGNSTPYYCQPKDFGKRNFKLDSLVFSSTFNRGEYFYELIEAFPFPMELLNQHYVLGKKNYSFIISEQGKLEPGCVFMGGGVLYDFLFINHVTSYTAKGKPMPGIFKTYTGETIHLTTLFHIR